MDYLAQKKPLEQSLHPSRIVSLQTRLYPWHCSESNEKRHDLYITQIIKWLDQALVTYSRGKASLFFLWNKLNAFIKGTYIKYVDLDENVASHQGLRCVPR